MREELYRDAKTIIEEAIAAVTPDEAVRRALEGKHPAGKCRLVAVGKAAWQMARAALECLEEPPAEGIVLTKYGHVKGPLPGIRCLEAGHPVPDDNSYRGTREVLRLTENLTEEDTVLFLLSGGGSALFEQPLIPARETEEITRQLLACGADITEMNTVRKRLSGVKGGRFAAHCAPARVEAVVLSDILGDPLDMIAGGPVTPDTGTFARAREIIQSYGIVLSAEGWEALAREAPGPLANVHTQIIGSVRQLCQAARESCRRLGYETIFLTDRLACEAREAGRFLASVAVSHAGCGRKLAFVAGGETVVHLTGKGLGGRNQELALAAAQSLEGLDAAVFSVGSDGTDGPTDAAGGYVDGDTAAVLRQRNIPPAQALADNDSYHALQAAGGLLVTGPTGTNVNDLTVALVGGKF